MDNTGQYASIVAFNSGTSAYVAYYDATAQDLRYVKATRGGSTPTTLTFTTPGTIDSTGNVGQYTSIVCSSDGVTIYISYYDVTNQHLKMAKSTNSGTSWSTQTVDTSTNVGKYTSIRINGSVVYISYYDTANVALKIAKSLDGGATW